MRRTRIVCTLGPSSNTPEIVRQLILNGLDVARLNFSHGTHDDHRALFAMLRSVAEELERNVAILMDLQGPRIRTGLLKGGGPVELVDGERLCLTARDVPGDAGCVSTTYSKLPHDVAAGDRILIADGTMELRVEEVAPPDVHCLIVRGGLLGQHKGMNLPGVAVSAPAMSHKDIQDLALALQLGADYVALSFVRQAEDVRDVKRRIAEAGSPARVVAKIERPEALTHFDAILEQTDAVMIARGDLGVETDLDNVPQVQKDLIRRCNACGTPVITATQMLESMVNHRRPTRAEVTDVANAIYDGADAVMLSGETAAGRFPIAAVSTMADIAAKADQAIAEAAPQPMVTVTSGHSCAWEGAFSHAIGHAVRDMIGPLDVKRIVCFTMSGFTAAAIARYRPTVPITAITLSEATQRRCALFWGVEAIRAAEVTNTDDMVAMVDDILLRNHFAKIGDTIVIVAGTPLAVGGRTNLLKLHTLGE
ncbi:MAG TPA: pyruvate kinase [Candidatus Hydrogenedentes bacterium]|nr:pyruvate kinase [Candidatus Hydrogenedentota bacterium]